MAKSKFGLTDKTIKMILDIFKENPEVKSVKIYGERALGTQNKHSDIFLVVMGNLSPIKLAYVALALDSLPVKNHIDVSGFEDLEKDLQKHIREDGKSFYFKP